MPSAVHDGTATLFNLAQAFPRTASTRNRRGVTPHPRTRERARELTLFTAASETCRRKSST